MSNKKNKGKAKGPIVTAKPIIPVWDAETTAKIEDANLQFIVLLQTVVEKTEWLEQHGYIYGTIKNFLVNGKKKYEEFISRVFSLEQSINGDTALHAANKIFVMQERVELALANQYMLTVDERRIRAYEVLNKHLAEMFPPDCPPELDPEVFKETVEQMIEKKVTDILEEMEMKNLFNF